MNNWISAICKTNEMKIHYLRSGGDKPSLVLLHGLIANGACWTEVAGYLEKEYDVIMPDARGHGKSSVPESAYSYEDHANDIIGLIPALCLSSPILIGHSMGGMTAAIVASRQPKFLSGVVLVDPPFLSPKIQCEVYESDITVQHQNIIKQSFDEVFQDARTRNPHRSLEILEILTQARFQTSLNAFAVLTPPYPRYESLVREIEIPILLVVSEGGVISPALSQVLQKMNPRLQVQCIHNASHGIHYDQPERFVDVLKAFIGSIRGTGLEQKHR